MNINEEIWDMQDLFRETKDKQEQNKLCIKIIKENDNRFRVKKKINNLTNSELKEQKGYIPKTAFVLSHLGLGDNITFIGAVRYLSTCYDKVIVVCKNKNVNNVKLFYSDDPDIEIFQIDDHLITTSAIINNFKEKLNINNLTLHINMNSDICDNDLKYICKTFKSLSIFYLNNCKNISDKGLFYLAKGM